MRSRCPGFPDAHAPRGSRRTGSRVRTLAAVPAVALALAGVLTGCAGPGENREVVGTSTPTPAVSAVETSVFQLSPGQCFDAPAEDGMFAVAVVPCEVAHDLEMYALFQLGEPSWPGADRVHELADAGCRQRFADLTGATPETSDHGYTMYTPSEGSWSEGDRQVQCVLQLNSGGRMVGSQMGSAPAT